MTIEELKPIIESLIYVSEEPITVKQLGAILEGESQDDIQAAADQLMDEFNARGGGLELRQLAGGYRITTRPELSEYVRRYLKSQPSARLSIAALETLAVIAYKQPITIPEILEIRGVTSTSAIKTLLDRRLIVARGHRLRRLSLDAELASDSAGLGQRPLGAQAADLIRAVALHCRQPYMRFRQGHC